METDQCTHTKQNPAKQLSSLNMYQIRKNFKILRYLSGGFDMGFLGSTYIRSDGKMITNITTIFMYSPQAGKPATDGAKSRFNGLRFHHCAWLFCFIFYQTERVKITFKNFSRYKCDKGWANVLRHWIWTQYIEAQE